MGSLLILAAIGVAGYIGYDVAIARKHKIKLTISETKENGKTKEFNFPKADADSESDK